MDTQTIDKSYEQLQQQSQQTVQLITALAQKLQAAANDGRPECPGMAAGSQGDHHRLPAEQSQVTLLLQAIHNFVANQAQQQQQQAPPPQQPVYQQHAVSAAADLPTAHVPAAYGGGGYGGFMGSSFGQAIATGAGFAIGEDIIDDIF